MVVHCLSLGLGSPRASENTHQARKRRDKLISTNIENEGDGDGHQIHAEMNGQKGLQTGECSSLLTCSRLGEE